MYRRRRREKDESDDGIIQCMAMKVKENLLIIEVVEERGETAFCDHVALICANGICVSQQRSCGSRCTWEDHLEKRCERVVAKGLREAGAERLAGPRVIT